MAIRSSWQRLATVVVSLCALGATTMALSGCGSATSVGNPPANPTPTWTPAEPSTTPSTTPAAAPTAAASKQPASPAPSGTASDGLVRTGTPSTGIFDTSTLTLEPASKGVRVIAYVVRVERGTGIKADEAARQVHATLNDKRGWMGTDLTQSRGVRFRLVNDPEQAELTLTIAAPPTVDALCPLDTLGVWSCEAGDTVLINSDRWLHRTPTYSDTATYRAYVVNHEVGHFLHLGHKPCPGKGRPAPVMMQQSKGLDGCVANPWPATSP